MASFVYFIQAGAAGPIKIGCTVDVPARLAALQLGHYEDLRVIAAISGNARRQEYKLHRRFAPLCIRGEWFRPDDDLLSFIGSLPAVDWNIATVRAAGADPAPVVLLAAKKLRRLLDAAGLSITLFCERHGLCRIAIQRLIKGDRHRQISVAAAMNVVRAYDLEAASLPDGEAVEPLVVDDFHVAGAALRRKAA